MKVKVSRETHFNAAHRLHNTSWPDLKNKEIFGKCNNPNYHGHNYQLIASIYGEIDPETGFVIDLKVLKNLLKKYIEDDFDHKNLNLEVSEFKELNPTAENIAIVIWNRLRPHISKRHTLEIKLYETARNFVTYYGE